ncbi:MAG: hypothetical protein AAF633_05690 [Chloroflexota bacterium]
MATAAAALGFADWHSTMVFLHVLTSIISMGAGAFPIIVRNGKSYHRTVGKIYIFGIFLVSLTGLLLIFDHFEPIRLILPLYALYAVFSSWRIIRHKGAPPTLIDWAFTLTSLLFAALLIGLGIFQGHALIDETTLLDTAMSLLIIACSILLIRDGIYDIIAHLYPRLRRQWWLYSHLERMVSSYIALWTGFMIHTVSNWVPTPYVYIAWVIPGSIGWVFSFFYILHRKRQKAGLPPLLMQLKGRVRLLSG